LTAEKRAAEKINEARKRKANRLKQAKVEAQQEIEQYRQEREKGFKEFESRHLGSRDDVALKIDKDTQRALADMQVSMQHNKEKVLQQLLALVYDIKPEIHKNLRVRQTGGQ